MCVCVCVCVCVTTLCDPMDCSPPGSSVHGLSQARILGWVAVSFSRDQTCMGRQILYPVTPGKLCRIEGEKKKALLALRGLLILRYNHAGSKNALILLTYHKQ